MKYKKALDFSCLFINPFNAQLQRVQESTFRKKLRACEKKNHAMETARELIAEYSFSGRAA